MHPDEHTLLIYKLVNGSYQPSGLFTHGDISTSSVLPGFGLNLETVFSNLE